MHYQFGDCWLDSESLEFARNGASRALEPQVFRLLLCLIENRGRVVSKDDLIEMVWDQRIVSDGALNTGINAARNAVGDDGKTQAVIKTFPRRGFRFVADVIEAVPASPAPAKPEALSLVGKPSIIILPFTNLTGDPDQDFIADGLRVDIANVMVRVSGVFIIAMTSSNLYRGKSIEEATNEMGVRYALEGNVRRAGKLLRISTTLTDTELGEIVWAEQFDRELDEAFEVIDEVIGKILTAMNVKLVAGESARVWHQTLKDLRSLEAFYRGVHEFFKMDKSSISEARRHFELVARLHPESSIGPTWIASTHWYEHQRGWSESREESKRLAKEWAEKAISLPDKDGMAQTMLCYIHLLDRDFDAALEAGKKGVENRPSCVHSNAFYANALHYCGEQQKARYFIELAMRYSPIHPAYYHDILASTCRATGDLDRAAEEAQMAIGTNPNDETARIILASLAVKRGQPSDAETVVQEIRNIDPEFSIQTFAVGQPYRSREFLEQFVAELREAGLPE